MQLLYSTILILSLFANLGLFSPTTLSVDIQENQAVTDYPEQITFSLKATSDEVIESVELIFGSDVISCGESLTRAFPEDYEPSKEVDVEWEWTLRRSGSLPPGTQVWWEWKLTDSLGNETLTERKTLTFTNESTPWEIYHSDPLEIYWVEGDQVFAREMAEAGETALDFLYEITGVELEEVIRVYIYPSAGEMQTATLFAPDWSGGIAFAEYRTVLAGVSPDSLTWGREVMAHELTHVLIGVYTFSCVSSMPIWLNEGLAMYAETSTGNSNDAEYDLLSEVVENNTLLTVREVSSIFSNDPNLARQAYAQSLSLVQYLIDEYGQEKMLAFLNAFSDGYSQDQALGQVYGFDQDSLNDAWREWIGAAPSKGTAIPEATATRTPYPTFPPITGPSGEVASTSTPVEEIAQAESATISPEPLIEETPEPGGPVSLGLPLSIVLGIVLVSVLLAGFVLTKRNRSLNE